MKQLKQQPTNEEQDAFALDHGGECFTLYSPYNHTWMLATEQEARQLRLEGWKIKWHLNLSDFGWDF